MIPQWLRNKLIQLGMRADVSDEDAQKFYSQQVTAQGMSFIDPGTGREWVAPTGGDQGGGDQGGGDQGGGDQGGGDQGGGDQAVRDQAVRDQAVRDQAVRDQAVRDQAVRDQAGGDQGGGDQGGGDQGSGAFDFSSMTPESRREFSSMMSPLIRQAMTEHQVERNAYSQQIEGFITAHGVTDSAVQASLRGAPTVSDAQAILLQNYHTRQAPAMGPGAFGSVTVGEDMRNKEYNAMRDALSMQTGLVTIEKPAGGHEQFMGASLGDMARRCLANAGIETSYDMSDVAMRALAMNNQSERDLATGTTSAFSTLLMDSAQTVLLNLNAQYERIWKLFSQRYPAKNFKTMYAGKIIGRAELQDLAETGEFKIATFSSSKDGYKVITKGIAIVITRNLIIDDDFNVVAEIVKRFVEAAWLMEGDMIINDMIIANKVMASDSTALFHANHMNLVTGATVGAISFAGLNEMRKKMRLQQDVDKRRMMPKVKYLLVPEAQAGDAEKLTVNVYDPTASVSQIKNPFKGLTPLSDARLDDASATAWYAFADPNFAPVIRYSYLGNNESPYIERQIVPGAGGLKMYGRHDFGAGIVNYVGAMKNPG